jgi:hypothetical protein
MPSNSRPAPVTNNGEPTARPAPAAPERGSHVGFHAARVVAIGAREQISHCRACCRLRVAARCPPWRSARHATGIAVPSRSDQGGLGYVCGAGLSDELTGIFSEPAWPCREATLQKSNRPPPPLSKADASHVRLGCIVYRDSAPSTDPIASGAKQCFGPASMPRRVAKRSAASRLPKMLN